MWRFLSINCGWDPRRAWDLVLKGAVAVKLSQPHLLFSYQGLRLLATMFSSLFLHGGKVHLLGNMWFLWLFGEALEDDLGHGRFWPFTCFAGSLPGSSMCCGRSNCAPP